MRLLLLFAFAVFVFAEETTVSVPSWSIGQSQEGYNLAVLSSLPLDTSKYVGFSVTSNFLRVSKPATTVMGALVSEGVIPDPFYGDRLKNISSEPFDKPWIFHGVLPQIPCSGAARLRLLGINYRANVYFNGHQIGDQNTTVGTFAVHDFDVTSLLRNKEPNVVLLQMFRPQNRALPPDNKDTDLANSFVDWAPTPPDSNLGVWKNVELRCVPGPVFLDSPLVETELSSQQPLSPSSPHAVNLTISVQASNFAAHKVKVQLSALIANSLENDILHKSNQVYELAAGESRLLSMDVLQVAKAHLWWPWQIGEPFLYNLQLNCSTLSTEDGASFSHSSSLEAHFGIRQIVSKFNKRGYRTYFINNHPIMIQGAGWSPDLFLRKDSERHLAEMVYVKDMNLNTVRLEGKFPEKDFYDLADEMGIFVMPGWCCCDSWQHWNLWGEEQMRVAENSMATQARELRIHPSMLVFVYSSDELPPANVETLYLRVLDEEKWPADRLGSASERTSKITGKTGVKMSGPYAWVPPNYWTQDLELIHNISLIDENGDFYPDATRDSHAYFEGSKSDESLDNGDSFLGKKQNSSHHLGGAWGFLTEGGPGASPLTLESAKKTFPEKYIWPLNDETWLHCGNPQGVFRDMRFFIPALEARYGAGKNAADFFEKSQVMAYESQRAMFEAYSRFRYNSATGLIQWMLNNAWPQNIWHLFDYYLGQGGGYFGTKKALTPLQAMYDPSDRTLWIVNSLYKVHSKVTFSANLYDLKANLVWSHKQKIEKIESDSSVRLGNIQVPHSKTGNTLLLFLSLDEKEENSNVYWISAKEDVLNWKETTFYITNCSSYANMHDLMDLECPNLKSELQIEENRMQGIVTLDNSKQGSIAFFVRLRLTNDGDEVLPIIWEDNFVTLLPGQKRTIKVTFPYQTLERDVVLVVETYNELSGKCGAK